MTDRKYNRFTITGWWHPYGPGRALAREPTHWMPLPVAPSQTQRGEG